MLFRSRERDVNTLGGNTLGLLREVRNFVLFRIHGCVEQRSLNENIFFVLYCFRKSFLDSSLKSPIQRICREWVGKLGFNKSDNH